MAKTARVLLLPATSSNSPCNAIDKAIIGLFHPLLLLALLLLLLVLLLILLLLLLLLSSISCCSVACQEVQREAGCTAPEGTAVTDSNRLAIPLQRGLDLAAVNITLGLRDCLPAAALLVTASIKTPQTLIPAFQADPAAPFEVLNGSNSPCLLLLLCCLLLLCVGGISRDATWQEWHCEGLGASSYYCGKCMVFEM
jgi:hypothetical protein